MKRRAQSAIAGWRRYRPWVAVAIGAAALLIAYGRLVGGAPAAPVVGMSLSGLVDDRGAVLDAAALNGRYQILAFGYTQCPDACPATLMKVRSLMTALEPSAQVIAPVFVTVDPEHDRPDLLGRYVHAFDPRILAVTGDRARIDAYAKSYGALGIRSPDPAWPANANHAVGLFLVAPTREILAIYDLATPTSLIANDIQRRIAAGRISRLASNQPGERGHRG